MYSPILASLLTRRPQTLVVVVVALLTLSWLVYGPGSGSGSGSGSYLFGGGIRSPVHRPLSLDDTQNNTLGFEKIFVVSLPTRTDRRDGVTLGAALTDLEFEFIDAVNGSTVPDKAIPMPPNMGRHPDPVIGAWRAHMNAIREVVKRNLSSALIMEDDTDWDVRIRGQMRDMALATRALTQPLSSNPRSYADPTFPRWTPDKGGAVDIPFTNLPGTVPPRNSPYGDNWDMLWLGQCGAVMPQQDDKVTPRGRVVRLDDVTVPQKKHLWSLTQPFELVDKYPQHTRVYHHMQDGVCMLAYAVTQRGARQMLHEIGLREVTAGVDLHFRWFCDGTNGLSYHRCLTTSPGLFNTHRPRQSTASSSDIGDHSAENGGYNERATTWMIRWSTRLNVDRFFEGTGHFDDQFPDDP